MGIDRASDAKSCPGGVLECEGEFAGGATNPQLSAIDFAFEQ
jgi:hypothetical protein